MKLAYFVAAAIIAASTGVSAQVMPWKMTSNQVNYQINYSMPYEGDAATDRAAATWSGAGSRFKLVNGGLTGAEDASQSASTDTPGTQVFSRPQSFLPASTTIAAVYSTAATNSTTSDADLIVSADRIAAGQFYFGTGTPPATQFDYETIILHELGHVAGFDHDPNLSAYCVMKPTILRGQVWRTLCDVERDALVRKYGAP